MTRPQRLTRASWLLALLVPACSEAPPPEVLPPDDAALDASDASDALDVSDLGRDDALDVVADAAKDIAVSAGDGAVACGDGGTCPSGLFCASGRCVRDTGPCAGGCLNDSRCVTEAGRCTPFTPGESAPMCTREIRPGVFSPAVQCRFSDAPAGDPFPSHLHVLSTPMVMDLRVYRSGPDDPVRPSIIAVFDDGDDGGSENPTGLIRVLDGATCALQDNLSEQLVSHSSPPAVADLDGDGAPEIVAFKAGGGLVAFRYQRASAGDAGADDGAVDVSASDASAPRGAWRVMWRSTRDGMPFEPTGGGWAGPTIADIDDDGRPEVLRHGMVFSGQTGAYLGGDARRSQLASYSAGAFTVALDVDEDGIVELVTPTGVFAWSAPMREWVLESGYARAGCTGDGCGEGQVAVANLGDWTSDRVRDAALPEIAVVSAGYVRVDTLDGRTVFGPIALPGGGTGGPPTVADFDGDGRPEIATAGARAYSVIDPDCVAAPTTARAGGRCASGNTTGVLWSQPSQDASSNVTGSTSFDFEGDGRVEAVYADECFARVYDGRTGAVLFSQHHSSCTWYENPVVADVDGDFRAEIVVGSNFNCGSATSGIACPGVGARNVDTLFAGVRCQTERDCLSGVCVEGFCRCERDAQCCPGGEADAGAPVECTYVCAAPPEGTPGMGNTCRASRPVGVRGLRVYSDIADRWVGSRQLWNQHVYHVTNVRDDGTVPRTSAVPFNWRDRTLNNFRTNTQGSVERMSSPDATSSVLRFDCGATGARITARVCNRGTSPLGDGLPVGVFDGDPAAGANRVCTVSTPRALSPGECVDLSCEWATPPTTLPGVTVYVRADDTATRRECDETNNLATLTGVQCRPPG